MDLVARGSLGVTNVTVVVSQKVETSSLEPFRLVWKVVFLQQRQPLRHDGDQPVSLIGTVEVASKLRSVVGLELDSLPLARHLCSFLFDSDTAYLYA